MEGTGQFQRAGIKTYKKMFLLEQQVKLSIDLREPWRGVLGFAGPAEPRSLHEQRNVSSVIITEDEKAVSEMIMKIFASFTF